MNIILRYHPDQILCRVTFPHKIFQFLIKSNWSFLGADEVVVAEVEVGSMAVLVVWGPALKALVPQEECRGEVTKEETIEVMYIQRDGKNRPLGKLFEGNMSLFRIRHPWNLL